MLFFVDKAVAIFFRKLLYVKAEKSVVPATCTFYVVICTRFGLITLTYQPNKLPCVRASQ